MVFCRSGGTPSATSMVAASSPCGDLAASFRLTHSPRFACGDAPPGHRSARSPTALQAVCSSPATKNQATHKGDLVFCRSGGTRTHGLLVPNQTRYQTALHLDGKKKEVICLSVSAYGTQFAYALACAEARLLTLIAFRISSRSRSTAAFSLVSRALT